MSTAKIKTHGGSIIVWSYISVSGFGDLVKIDGVINAEKCQQILIHHAGPSGRHLIGHSLIFQYDDDAKMTASASNTYLYRKTHSGTL